MVNFTLCNTVGIIMKLAAKTLYGLENVLAQELAELGASETEVVNRAVLFSGNREVLYRVNYCSATALSVLMPVSEFSITSGDDLHNKALKINWSAYMDADNTFSVIPVVNSKLFGHTGYPGLVLKDAIADFFRRKTGKRPSVHSTDPVIVVNLHISNDRVTISLDSSGIPLFKRGYRSAQGTAPLNEVLAAGIIRLSGWNGAEPLLDPMCGSGTFPIEAGLMARKIPPGKFRNHFGFTRWKDFDGELFSRIKRESDDKITRTIIKLAASDISDAAVKQCKVNVERAGLSDLISVEVCDFRNVKPEFSNGFVFINPPYGKRIISSEPDKLYSMIGTVLKHNFAGHKAWIISSEKQYLNMTGLKPVKKYKLYNGSLECTLAGYELYEGSRKKDKR